MNPQSIPTHESLDSDLPAPEIVQIPLQYVHAQLDPQHQTNIVFTPSYHPSNVPEAQIAPQRPLSQQLLLPTTPTRLSPSKNVTDW